MAGQNHEAGNEPRMDTDKHGFTEGREGNEELTERFGTEKSVGRNGRERTQKAQIRGEKSEEGKTVRGPNG
jgi:hypothetical protein